VELEKRFLNCASFNPLPPVWVGYSPCAVAGQFGKCLSYEDCVGRSASPPGSQVVTTEQKGSSYWTLIRSPRIFDICQRNFVNRSSLGSNLRLHIKVTSFLYGSIHKFSALPNSVTCLPDPSRLSKWVSCISTAVMILLGDSLAIETKNKKSGGGGVTVTQLGVNPDGHAVGVSDIGW